MMARQGAPAKGWDESENGVARRLRKAIGTRLNAASRSGEITPGKRLGRRGSQASSVSRTWVELREGMVSSVPGGPLDEVSNHRRRGHASACAAARAPGWRVGIFLAFSGKTPLGAGYSVSWRTPGWGLKKGARPAALRFDGGQSVRVISSPGHDDAFWG